MGVSSVFVLLSESRRQEGRLSDFVGNFAMEIQDFYLFLNVKLYPSLLFYLFLFEPRHAI